MLIDGRLKCVAGGSITRAHAKTEFFLFYDYRGQNDNGRSGKEGAVLGLCVMRIRTK